MSAPAAPAGAARVAAPFGRRAAVITDVQRLGAYTVLTCEDPGGPPPAPGQFYMLTAAARRRGGAVGAGGEGERPFLPRAFSVLRTAEVSDRASGRLPLQFLLEDVGPGTARLCQLAAGEQLLLVGPLGNGFAPPRAGRTPLLLGGGVGIAPLAICQDRLDPRPRALLGFRDAARVPGGSLLQNVTLATDDGSAGHHGLVTDLLVDALAADPEHEVYACGPPAMLEAVRRLCARGGTPAQLALRRSARLRRGAAGALSVLGVRLKDGDAGAPSGQPAPAPLGAARRTAQLDRPAEQGALQVSGRGPTPSGGAVSASDRQRHGLQRRGGGRARAGVRLPAAGGGAGVERVLPQRGDGAGHGGRPRELSRLLHRVRPLTTSR